MWGPRSIIQGKAKNFGDLYEITLHYIWGQRSKVNYPKYLKQKISVTSIFMKTHFKRHKKIVQSIQYSWNMMSGARNYTSLHVRSKVNYPRKSKKFRWPLWNYTSLHLRSKVQGQLSKVSKANNFGDLYEITLHYIWGQRSMVQGQLSKVSKAKNFGDLYEITLHYIWGQRSKVNFQGQLSKVSKAKNFGDLYEITLHYIWGQRSKVNYPKYLKQKISVTSIFMKTHFKRHKKIVQSIQYSWNMMSGARNYTSLHVRSKVNYPKYLKQKISVTSMKLHFITFEVKGPWSISKVNYPKYLKQKISVTSMKLHFITFEVKGPWSISKVNYPKYLKQKISVTSMKLHFITFEVKGPRSIIQSI